MNELQEILNPVSETLRNLCSHDPHDHWLAQETGFTIDVYGESTHVLIGCPQDEGVRRNNGRPGAAEAPDKIRERLYRMQVSPDSGIHLYDAGNIICTSLEESHDRLTKAVAQFLADDKRVIVLGGGNDISFADVRAMSGVYGDISAINVDAHLDMRIAEKMTSGTPYRRLIEGDYLQPERFHEFGIRPASNAAYYLDDAENRGVNLHYLDEILNRGLRESFRRIISGMDESPLFLGLDMDSVQAADAPGVSASSPIGFSGREMLQIVEEALNYSQLKLLEITEVNPNYDVDGRTAKLSASLVYRFLFG
ncbi:MAG: formimidoylglutamase [Candidatus Marinimicrobia bacterium]|nr:formimidoylglutamase [Candidatus Neomarinimicrobiota bacterium]MCF7829408.1 formimidoylglutamase [Candidatus Neomarinimicrobiota bacterium]MCF7880894.1 formimidoylglutamase [Candidatus Neomarinimicrobiota bacterium]